MKAWCMLSSNDHTQHCSKEKKDSYKQIYNLKKEYRWTYSRCKNLHHPEFQTAIQEKRKIAAADPSPPPIFSKTDLQQKQESQQQQGSRIRSEPSWSGGERSRARGGLAIVVVRRQPVEYLVFLEPR